VLDMFPYPSGSGLHVGHPEGYTASDVMARYWRMCDLDVLHPMVSQRFSCPGRSLSARVSQGGTPRHADPRDPSRWNAPIWTLTMDAFTPLVRAGTPSDCRQSNMQSTRARTRA
jgi:leucyl-tRNA synthetase